MRPLTPPEGGPGSFATLGMSDGDELVLRALLAGPGDTASGLAARLGWRSARVRGHLSSLEALGMLTHTADRPTRFTPAAPDAAVEILALRRREEIEHARLEAARLAEEFRTNGPRAAGSPVTVVSGREAVAQRFLQAQRAATGEVLVLGRPASASTPHRRDAELRREQLAKGVSYRAVYDRSSLDGHAALDEARSLAALGERCRVLDEVPLRLVIADRRLGLVPSARPDVHEIVVVEPSPLLAGLVALFESLWRRAAPLWQRDERTNPDGSGLSAGDRELLSLSAAGLTDQAIARRLGVSRRTVERRMRRIMDRLGAKTRFQAGLQAALLGVIIDTA
ncbi:LuxR C-terminal-related transcriptional regulator [Phytomonospora sp. NPDC050363]|uniref:LuxR C-terminal-related transcriptional regulator n=1 Tax=Phytomonospora sp. NPDC050363 TaxID=3155642 RepID=UPI00340FCA09